MDYYFVSYTVVRLQNSLSVDNPLRNHPTGFAQHLFPTSPASYSLRR
jgi:hypothetical protein